MSDHAVESKCLFCAPGCADNRIIAENGTCYARWDNYPLAPGHCEVVPRRHVESLFDLTAQEVGDLYALLVEARGVVGARYCPDGYTIGVNEGRAAGRTIDHLHVHLIPRRFGDVPDPSGGIRAVLPGPHSSEWTASEVHTEESLALTNQTLDAVVEAWPKE